MIDYRALLKKYIDHVWECEGISYEPGTLTDDEAAEFRAIVAELETVWAEKRRQRMWRTGSPIFPKLT